MLTFDFYYDIQFWILFSAIVIVFRLVSFNSMIRKLFLATASSIMLLALPRFNVSSFLLLFGISLITYSVGYFINKENGIRDGLLRIVITTAMLLLIITTLAIFKYSYLQKLLWTSFVFDNSHKFNFIFLIGISYLSFKMMHFIIESYKRKIEKLSILNFVNYIFFFPAFISGPINRYNQFSQEIISANNNHLSTDIKIGLERIINGLFKKFVLATIVYPYVITNIQNDIAEISVFKIILGLYAYTLYIYFDFAGYSDIAIGSARIMGITLPENFNNPFLKKNIQQVWANWHISFTGWLTDYIYWPLSRKLRNAEYLRTKPILLSNISIVITFIVCGMWHGETINFVVWGIYHGIGLAVLNIYQKQKRKTRNNHLRKYFKSKSSHWIGVAFTFSFFAMGILFFAMKMDEISILLRRLI